MQRTYTFPKEMDLVETSAPTLRTDATLTLLELYQMFVKQFNFRVKQFLFCENNAI